MGPVRDPFTVSVPWLSMWTGMAMEGVSKGWEGKGGEYGEGESPGG